MSEVHIFAATEPKPDKPAVKPPKGGGGGGDGEFN